MEREQPSPPRAHLQAAPAKPERLCEVVAPRRPRMTKESRVRAVTIAIIAAAAVVAIGRKADWSLPVSDTGPAATARPQSETKPQEVIYRMLDAANQGDASAYLECYSGALLRRLRQSRDEMTPDGFARYLVQTNEQIKGVAISEPEARAESEVDVRVEFVYQDRNEAQTFSLEKTSGEWKIERVSAAERVEALVPYGTPVY